MTKPFSSCLVAPLDWGLGHAGRCIPLIHTLLSRKIVVHIACSKAQQEFFALEFPGVPLLLLKPPGVRYTRLRWLQLPYLFLQGLMQFPNEVKERRMLLDYMKKNALECLVSDSRPMLLRRNIPCIYLSHQLHIPSGWVGRMATYIQVLGMRMAIRTWIPDYENASESLAGKLSHPAPMQEHGYIGPMSRWQVREFPQRNPEKLLIILSGPEPLRTILETKILAQIKDTCIPFVLVRGNSTAPALPEFSGGVVYSLADTVLLARLFANCRGVISRGGYSSVMDHEVLGIPWLMVPTPGQPEQEYLAVHLKSKQGITWVEEHQLAGFDLKAWWEKLPETALTKNPGITGALQKELSDFFRPAR